MISVKDRGRVVGGVDGSSVDSATELVVEMGSVIRVEKDIIGVEKDGIEIEMEVDSIWDTVVVEEVVVEELVSVELVPTKGTN